MRVTVLVFSALVCAYAIASQGTPIYEMVSGAYQITLVGAFVPLAAGLYWERATTQGALAAILLGIAGWIAFQVSPLGTHFPAQLAGVLLSTGGMVCGSLLPQRLSNTKGSPHRPTGIAL
jgi:Na+/proline symporter